MRILGLLMLLVAACSGGPPDGSRYVPGKADGVFSLVEAGPLEVGAAQPARVRPDAVPAFRVESYGGTALALSLDGRDGYLVVEGPLSGDGDTVPPGSGPVLAQDAGALAVTLEAPGVYRVIAGTASALARGQHPKTVELTLASRCTAACWRPELSQAEFLASLREAGTLRALLDQIHAQLGQVIPDAQQRDALSAQLDRLVAQTDFAGLERFPTLPLRQLGDLRPALGLIPATPPEPDAVVGGELGELLGPCKATRADPPPVSASLPGVGYGHFPNRALSPCQLAHSVRLAQILTSLAAENGSWVTYRGARLRSPAQLVQALLDAGHTIEARNERTYANFISLTYGDRNVRWPVWIDTGVALASGESLVVPMGHSHHAWRISGPDLDARVMFYLGISGAAFFAQIDVRPAWTGLRVQPAGEVTASFEVAARYLRRIRSERATVAAGLPADGYGFVGVCNDSNAVMEYLTRGSITTFPLLRAAALDGAPTLGDGLDEVLRLLPHDADRAPERRDGLRRILAMSPHRSDSPLLFDDALRAQLKALEDEAGPY